MKDSEKDKWKKNFNSTEQKDASNASFNAIFKYVYINLRKNKNIGIKGRRVVNFKAHSIVPLLIISNNRSFNNKYALMVLHYTGLVEILMTSLIVRLIINFNILQKKKDEEVHSRRIREGQSYLKTRVQWIWRRRGRKELDKKKIKKQRQVINNTKIDR